MATQTHRIEIHRGSRDGDKSLFIFFRQQNGLFSYVKKTPQYLVDFFSLDRKQPMRGSVCFKMNETSIQEVIKKYNLVWQEKHFAIRDKDASEIESFFYGSVTLEKEN